MKRKIKTSIGILLSVLMIATMIPVLPVAAASNSYKDVSAGDWFYDSVQYVTDNGLFFGTSEDTFEPQTTMTRAMIVTVLHRMEKQPAAEPASFKDVSSGTWFTDAVAWAAADGIVNGYDADTFAPDDNVSREQIVTILFRYSEKKGYDVSEREDLTGYSDNDDISDWARAALEWANAEELIKGYPDNTIVPGGSATRAEVAAILMRFCENIVNPGEDADVEDLVILWDESWQYADYSEIHSSDVTLYRAQKPRKDVTVALNAGHGTSGGSSVKTWCHPDKTPKVVNGSTAAGETMAVAVGDGTTMLDGTPERDVTLALALVAKEKLLNAGYDVLMIRETEDVQLDNIARTVIANQYADCHIALHYDASDSDKGLFYIDVPDVDSYRNMEPVASHWKEHHALGEAILSGMRDKNVRIYGDGTMAIDLTQTSYSTIPSIDLEMGDRASDVSQSTLETLSEGLVKGLDQFFGK